MTIEHNQGVEFAHKMEVQQLQELLWVLYQQDGVADDLTLTLLCFSLLGQGQGPQLLHFIEGSEDDDTSFNEDTYNVPFWETPRDTYLCVAFLQRDLPDQREGVLTLVKVLVPLDSCCSSQVYSLVDLHTTACPYTYHIIRPMVVQSTYLAVFEQLYRS